MAMPGSPCFWMRTLSCLKFDVVRGEGREGASYSSLEIDRDMLYFATVLKNQ
jgi:hypothetical protein